MQLRPGQALGAGAVTGPRERARVETGNPPGRWGLLTVKGTGNRPTDSVEPCVPRRGGHGLAGSPAPWASWLRLLW